MSTPRDMELEDRPSSGSTAVRSALALLPQAQAIADRSVDWVCEHDPEYRDLVSVEALAQASRLCVRLVLSQVAGRPLDDELQLAPQAIGRGRAGQAAPLEAVLRALRIDYRLVWEAMLDLAARDETLDMLELLTDGAARVWDVIDEISVGVAAAYREVEVERRRSSEEQTRILMGTLLRGSAPLTSAVREAAIHTGLSPGERYVVCCVAAGTAPMISEEAVRRALDEAGLRSAWYSEAGTHVGAIQIRNRSVDAVTDALRSIPGIRAGMSLESDGLAGVREKVWQAEAALGSLATGTTGLATLQTELLAIIASDAQDLSSLLAEQVLGPLSSLRPAERKRILRTVTAYTVAGGSVAATAAALHYHRNTIINHLRLFEQVTGRSLHDPRSLAEVVLALEAERLDRLGSGSAPAPAQPEQ